MKALRLPRRCGVFGRRALSHMAALGQQGRYQGPGGFGSDSFLQEDEQLPILPSPGQVTGPTSRPDTLTPVTLSVSRVRTESVTLGGPAQAANPRAGYPEVPVFLQMARTAAHSEGSSAGRLGWGAPAAS